jgi:hypothetical protein
MVRGEHRLLDSLKAELEFLEAGGYIGLARDAWRCKFFFEDSPTCAHYTHKNQSGACSDCILMQLVPCESRGERIPCRHIPLNAEGETLDSLYRYANQYETQQTFVGWLRSTIARLEDEAALASSRRGP